MNSDFGSLIKELNDIDNHTTDKDILTHYMVNKKSNSKKTDLSNIINFVIVYIQNNEIYFKYEPTFWNKVLIFGIIGTKKEQTKLKKDLGKIINKLGGKLNILLKGKKK